MNASRPHRLVLLPAMTAAVALALWCGPSSAGPPADSAPGLGAMRWGPDVPVAAPSSSKLPAFDHVVLVVMENKRESSIIGSPLAPYLNWLAKHGASFTQSFGVTHPSQPNYLALFSGSTQGVVDDSCPHTFSTNNEAHELIKAGFTFKAYSEGLPYAGAKDCVSGAYARKHAPWTNFPNVAASDQQPYTSYPAHHNRLPDVSWVVPNLCDDMHDCSITTGDAWLKAHLGGYASWARTHNSLLVVTFDEDDSTGDNQIATIFFGAHVRTGSYPEHITHYNVLRTIEDMYGVPRLGYAATAKPITDVWK